MTRRTRIRWTVAVVAAAVIAGPAVAAIEHLPNDRIQTALRTELRLTRGVPADAIEVGVADGVVTLTGQVDNILARERAVRVAKQLRGVETVIDRIEVRPPKRSNSELRADVIEALAEDPATHAWEIGVAVDDGKVKLDGRVDSYAERELAETVAKGVRGVRGIDNQISVDWLTRQTDSEIQNEIEQRLRWDTHVDSALIDVAVKDGNVTLSGAVGSAFERTKALELSWVKGVRDVNDDALEVRWWARDEMKRNDDWPQVTDQEIRKAIQRALLYDPRVVSFEPTVEVKDGIVTLRGVVDNAKAKKAAARDANDSVGVWYVRNFLEVRGASLPDAQVEKNVLGALRRDPYVSDLGIGVSAVDGKVYLYGDVDSYFERAAAGDVAARAAGVLEVDNQLHVAYSDLRNGILDRYETDPLMNPYAFDHETISVKSDESIKKDIQSEFFWSPFVDADSIHVSVSHGKATLTGTVGSWHERTAATENALEGGAVEVVNELEVRPS